MFVFWLLDGCLPFMLLYTITLVVVLVVGCSFLFSSIVCCLFLLGGYWLCLLDVCVFHMV